MLPLCSRLGAAQQKIVCVREVPGVTGPLRKVNSDFVPPKEGRGCVTVLRQLLIGVGAIIRLHLLLVWYSLS